VAYVPEAVRQGDGRRNLQPIGAAAGATHLVLAGANGAPLTQVALFDQGLVQFLQAAVTGLEPKQPYVLALSNDAKGERAVEPLASFMTNPAGAAIVNAVGPIRQILQGAAKDTRILVIVAGTPEHLGGRVQTQLP
jgi:hypothetical protein